MARSIPGFENRYHGKEIELDFDPIPTCKHCGRPMKVQSRFLISIPRSHASARNSTCI